MLMRSAPEPKLTLRERQTHLRVEAIIEAVTRLLAEFGFEAMTVDQVAADVGMSKASLYKHFASKEQLAAAVMVRLLDQTIEKVESLAQDTPAIDRLREVLRWALASRMQGGLPLLPSTSPALRAALMSDQAYLQRVGRLNELVDAVIEQAQKDGSISSALPREVVLLSLYSRTCDPAVDYLRLFGTMSDEKIVEAMVAVCFAGLASAKLAMEKPADAARRGRARAAKA